MSFPYADSQFVSDIVKWNIHRDSLLESHDMEHYMSVNRTERDWDILMGVLMPDLVSQDKKPRKKETKPRKKYEHTPKWFKKKMLQELNKRILDLYDEENDEEFYWKPAFLNEPFIRIAL